MKTEQLHLGSSQSDITTTITYSQCSMLGLGLGSAVANRKGYKHDRTQKDDLFASNWPCSVVGSQRLIRVLSALLNITKNRHLQYAQLSQTTA